jgi:hypothetical protein
MATPGELVETLSTELGLPLNSIAQYDRHLVVEGLRTKNGRGTSAARVTTQDAAHLIVAVLGSLRIREAIFAVNRYAACRISEGSWADCSMPTMEALPKEHNFIDALCAMIDAARNGELRRFLDQPALDEETRNKRIIFPHEQQVTVSARMPSPEGVFELRGSRRAYVRYSLVFPRLPGGEVDWEEAHRRFGPAIPDLRTDLSQISMITARTILAVAARLEGVVAETVETADAA